MDQLADSLVGLYPGITLLVEKQNEGPPTGKPINIEVSGEDFISLLHLTDTIQTVISNDIAFSGWRRCNKIDTVPTAVSNGIVPNGW